ncbi:BA3454 family stress response protein [Priestia megaterium]|nr:BA3454 family stress response protein [Priestia megaterium]MDM8151072.1 BA3454 family stress response protein [Priestia megaterium]
MIEVFVTVKIKDKNYKTNVIVHKGLTKEEIISLAEEQVKKQWDL